VQFAPAALIATIWGDLLMYIYFSFEKRRDGSKPQVYFPCPSFRIWTPPSIISSGCEFMNRGEKKIWKIFLRVIPFFSVTWKGDVGIIVFPYKNCFCKILSRMMRRAEGFRIYFSLPSASSFFQGPSTLTDSISIGYPVQFFYQNG